MVHLVGTPIERTIQIRTRMVRAPGGKVSHYEVDTYATGLPPGGGTAEERIAARTREIVAKTTNSRGPVLPAAVVAHAARVRHSLPKTSEEWGADIPHGPTQREALISQIAESEAHLTYLRDNLAADLLEDAKLPSAAQPMRTSQRIEIKTYTNEGIYLRDKLANMNLEVDEPPLAPPVATNGYALAMPSVQAHLDEVLKVGTEAQDAIRAQFLADPEWIKIMDRHKLIVDVETKANAIRSNMLIDDATRWATISEQNDRLGPRGVGLPRTFEASARAGRGRELAIIREMLASARPFGGAHHTDATGVTHGDSRLTGDVALNPPRDDWRERLRAAEGFYPLKTLSMPTGLHDPTVYDGALPDHTAEVVLHELGHRMEDSIAGLSYLEHAMVIRRSTTNGILETPRPVNDFSLQAEDAFHDRWANPYTGRAYQGKSPEAGAGAWELFTTGMQDTFGRGSKKHDNSGELQAFVLGALLTLG